MDGKTEGQADRYIIESQEATTSQKERPDKPIAHQPIVYVRSCIMELHTVRTLALEALPAMLVVHCPNRMPNASRIHPYTCF